MLSLRSVGIAITLGLGWLLLDPATASAQVGCLGPVHHDNCTPSRYQMMLLARQAQYQMQQMMWFQAAAYQQAMYQQMLANQQLAAMAQAQQQLQQQLQQVNSPRVNDPFLAPVAANLPMAAPAPRNPPAQRIEVNGQPLAREPLGNRRPDFAVQEPPIRDKEEEAASKLKFAKMLADDGLLAKARTRFGEIAEKYPGTRAAEEAQVLLAKK